MAIGTTAAIIGASVIAGGASIFAGSKAAKAQKNAASAASDSALQTAQMNNALQREVYTKNQEYLSPYSQRGNDAGNAINSLLGLGGTGATGNYVSNGGTDWAGYVNANPDALANWNAIQGTTHDDPFNGSLSAFGQYHYGADGSRRDLSPFQMGAASTGGTGGTGSAQSAFDNYLNSTGYQFQMDQGTKALGQNWAAKGARESGAAMKALQTYGQETGKSFFKDYLGLLSNQQGVGLAGASAIAGVGSNYANSVSANNNNASIAAQQAAYGQGNATAGMWGNVAGAIGGVANAFGSSYGGGSAANSNALAIGRSGWG